jgi:hypothetical protein
MFLESPYHTVDLQNGHFAASNPILTLHQVQKIKMRTKQQIKTIKHQNAPWIPKSQNQAWVWRDPRRRGSSLKPSRRPGSTVTHGGRDSSPANFLISGQTQPENTKKRKSNLKNRF